MQMTQVMFQIDAGVKAEDITSWRAEFWNKAFSNGIIPAHGNSDIHGENRFNANIDLGADEV